MTTMTVFLLIQFHTYFKTGFILMAYEIIYLYRQQRLHLQRVHILNILETANADCVIAQENQNNLLCYLC